MGVDDRSFVILFESIADMSQVRRTQPGAVLQKFGFVFRWYPDIDLNKTGFLVAPSLTLDVRFAFRLIGHRLSFLFAAFRAASHRSIWKLVRMPRVPIQG